MRPDKNDSTSDFAKAFRQLQPWETTDTLVGCLERYEGNTEALCADVMKLLGDEARVREDDVRIGACRILIACLPISFQYIERLVEDFSRVLYDELHTNIFTFLSEGIMTDEATARCASLAETYVSGKDLDHGQAFGSAIRFLSYSLPPEQAFFALMRIARNAALDHARVFALDYAEHLLPSLKENDRAVFRNTAEWMTENDPSRRARSCASEVVGRIDRSQNAGTPQIVR